MAIGTLAAILGGLAIGGAAAGITKAISNRGGGGGPTAPLPLPQPPAPSAAADRAQEIGRRKMAAATKSIYTSPLGVAGEAQVVRKTLLGQ